MESWHSCVPIWQSCSYDGRMKLHASFMCCSVPLIMLTVVGPAAFASGNWDGSWVLDKILSRQPDVMELGRSSNGSWHFFDGYSDRAFLAHASVHRAGSSGLEDRVSMPDARTLSLTESIYGRDYRRYALSLSTDGQVLTMAVRSLPWDGRPRETSKTYLRSRPGKSFQGAWRLAPNAAPAPSTQAAPAALPAQPFWVIWTGLDGTMTWFIPPTGELLRGKTDGLPRPIHGPLYDGETFAWKQSAPNRIEFTAFLDGQPEEYAVETISQDGQTFTDTLWAPGHEDCKVISVFHKIPQLTISR